MDGGTSFLCTSSKKVSIYTLSFVDGHGSKEAAIEK
jgi:hypothetical protein